MQTPENITHHGIDDSRQGTQPFRARGVRGPSASRTDEDGAEGHGGRQPPIQGARASTPDQEAVHAASEPATPRANSNDSESPSRQDTPRQALPPQTATPQRPEDDFSQHSPPRTPQAARPYQNLPRSARPNRIRTAPSTKHTKAHLLVATENMKGRGSPKIRGNKKWQKLAKSIFLDRIGVMAVQETHLTDAHLDELKTCYKDLHVVNTAHPENPAGAGGVALVFNKKLTNTTALESHVLVEGRALLVTLNWHRNDELTILAIYGPNDKQENHQMWADMEEKIRTARGRLPKPDILLGDFNFVEDDIDRFPAKLNDADCPPSFDSLKNYLRLTDGWRETNPTDIEYTWRDAARTKLSRIDRIYLTRSLALASRSWKIEITDLNRHDHSRVSVELVNIDAPFIGPGRWTMSPDLADDKEFLEAVDTLGQHALQRIRDLNDGRSDAENAQTIYKDFKTAVIRTAKRHQRELNCKRNAKLADLAKQRETAKQAMRNATPRSKDGATANFKAAEEKLEDEKAARSDAILSNRSTRTWATAETVCKTWLGWTKSHTPRDTMLDLQTPESNPPQFVRETTAMAELARDYHENLQTKDIHQDANEREAAIQEALRHAQPSEAADMSQLEKLIDEEDVKTSLAASANGKAAGLDGLIYELWKAINRRYESSRGCEHQTFNIIELLTRLYQDIETHGLIVGSDFAEGWMCPFYKKGDRTIIANYRPITLLNTDYKIYTKALSLKLATAAPALINPAQAGFVKGRSIVDHTKITSLITEYAEATEENGMIVALDQEKAYDKVAHDYLWRVLRKLEIPQRFIDTVAQLYGQANTSVMINGVLSSPYRVTRGVRQGDPLSCLLFNLAIEPLAEMLRRSDISGYEIPGMTDRLIATLYADDTTVYLSENDSYTSLLHILDTWCKAATAKFNVLKTEIVPLGTEIFRSRLVTTRRLNRDDTQIPGSVRIARDGESIRILGTWTGNKVDGNGTWTPIVDKVADRLDRWTTSHPTHEGKSLLLQIYAGGMTQYLTAAQGMPKKIEERLSKLTMDFFWDGSKKHPINAETLRKLKHDGGKALFDVATRNEAAYVVWLSRYLAPQSERPIWAYIADSIFSLHARVADDKKIPAEMRVNPFCQNWKPNPNKLPFILKQILRVARKYDLVLDRPYIPYELRTQMPAWQHPGRLARARENNPAGKCLKKNHEALLVEHLEELAEMDEPDHVDAPDCDCENCTEDRTIGCQAPNKCADTAGDLLAILAPKWNLNTASLRDDDEGVRAPDEEDQRGAIERGEPLMIQPYAEKPSDIAHLYRIFARHLSIDRETAPDEILVRDAATIERTPSREPTQVIYACGSTINGRTHHAQGGFAVHFPNEDGEDQAGKCAGAHQSQERSAVTAVLRAAALASNTRDVFIITNSQSAVKKLTTLAKKNEREGWMNQAPNDDVFRQTMAAVRKRAGRTTIACVTKKHNRPETKVMERTTDAAREAARLEREWRPDDATLATFDAPGAALHKITQRAAHKAIKLINQMATPERRRTQENLQKTRDSIRRHNGTSPTDEQIWRATKAPVLSRNVKNFMWKALHGGHKIGHYFTNMPAPWSEYAICPLCNVTESLEHILFTCSSNETQTIWTLAKDFLQPRLPDLPPLDIGSVLGCPLINMKDPQDKTDHGLSRVLHITISESAFLIWKIRCERRIEHEDRPDDSPSAEEVKGRWYAMMNQRIAHDRRLTNKRRFKNKAIKEDLVLDTWNGLLDLADDVPENWIRHPGVLVGRGTSRPRGRER